MLVIMQSTVPYTCTHTRHETMEVKKNVVEQYSMFK